ncbi:MAG TPA: PDZ domain-containing protein [Gemmatimonadaceae bacterium]
MRPSTLLLGALAVSALAAPAAAQDRAERELARARVFARSAQIDEDRPVIGVSTSSSGERDTLGLLVVSVTPGGPADQAGIEEGNRIAAVNGTNLRLAAVDAGERDMQGMTTRRLVRELQKVEPGAEVELRVWQNGRYRDVKVKTVAAAELPGRKRVSREEHESRGVLGLRVGGSGSRRDTLGVLVVGLATDGPAEKAGLVEGDRIAAIGDVDLRVPAADAGDDWMSRTRVNRLLRELRDVKPGESVTLLVRSGGAARTVNITAVAAKDLADEEGAMFFFGDGFGMDFDVPMPAMAPMAPMAPMTPSAPMRLRTPAPLRVMPGVPGVRIIELDDDTGFESLAAPEVWADGSSESAVKAAAGDVGRLESMRLELEAAREAVEARERALLEREARLRAAPRDVVRSASWVAATPAAAPTASTARTANTLSLPGLTLALVNEDLASTLGAGSERGLLVLAADERWDGLRDGDVILAVDGRATTGFSCVSSLANGERTVLVLRDGGRATLTVNGGR